MTAMSKVAEGCRRDRHYAIAVAGIGFWAFLGVALFALDAVNVIPRY